MNGVLWIFINILGQLMTSAVTMNHIYEKIVREHEHSGHLDPIAQNMGSMSLGDEDKIKRQLIPTVRLSDLKEVFQAYSKYILLDLIFEVIKTAVVFLARMYNYIPHSGKFDDGSMSTSFMTSSDSTPAAVVN